MKCTKSLVGILLFSLIKYLQYRYKKGPKVIGINASEKPMSKNGLCVIPVATSQNLKAITSNHAIITLSWRLIGLFVNNKTDAKIA